MKSTKKLGIIMLAGVLTAISGLGASTPGITSASAATPQSRPSCPPGCIPEGKAGCLCQVPLIVPNSR
jgi:hypothetical protein